MVVGAFDHRTDPAGIANRAWGKLGPGAFYLYAFLSFFMDRSKQSETLLAIMFGLIVLYWFKRWDGLLAAAALTGFAGLLVPVVGQGAHWGWTRLSLLLGKLSGSVLLT